MKFSVAYVENFLDSHFRRAFGALGTFVGRFPIVIVVFLTLLSLVLGLLGPKFALKESSDVSQLYTPLDAPSRFEHNVAIDFFQSTSGKPYAFLAIIRSKHGKNLFEDPFPSRIREFKDYLMYSFNVFDEESNSSVAFADLCAEFCDINDRIDEMFVLKKASFENSALTYPTMLAFNRPVYLGNHIYGVETHPENGTIKSIAGVALQFRAIVRNSEMETVLRQWESSFFDMVSQQGFPPEFDSLNVTVFSHGVLSTEVRRSGTKAAPFFGLSFSCLLLFSVMSCLKLNKVKSKPWEAVAGVFCPILALMTAFGMLILLGRPFLSLLVVTPFLVLAVGVDDAFLLIHAWQKSDDRKTVPQRLADTLADCGPAITLTSLTNAVSFGIGSLSPTPAIQYFCTYTAVSVAVAYFYQLTFFAGAMAIGGRREAQGRSAYCCTKHNAEDEKPTMNGTTDHSTAVTNVSTKLSKMKFLTRYCRQLNRWPMKLVTLLIVACYWSTAIFGCTKLRTVLSSEKLLAIDSPLQDYLVFERDRIWRDSVTLSVFVNNVPDLTDSRNIGHIEDLVRDFESLSRSRGPNSTNLWILEYLRMVNDFEFGAPLPAQNGLGAPVWPNVNFTYDWFPDFFIVNHVWSKFVKLTPDGSAVDSFFFTTSFGDPEWNWEVWGQQLIEWRDVAARHQLNVTVYHSHTFYADQMLSIRSVTFRTVFVTFICMAVACGIFIPHPMSIFCALVSLGSINVGVLGFLTLWNVNLDPISMATILMSIGLSVDFVSHVSYHYFRNSKTEDICLRIEDSLSAVAWPLVQAGVSTILSVLALSANHAYMTDVFVKTILLVVALGLLHGLLILPVLLLEVSNVGRWLSVNSRKLRRKNQVGTECQSTAQEANGIPMKS